MRTKKQSTPQEPPKVYCCECRHFMRDTSGRSRNAETGEYFMGVCAKGLHPDSPIKQFANKPRHCEQHINTAT